MAWWFSSSLATFYWSFLKTSCLPDYLSHGPDLILSLFDPILSLLSIVTMSKSLKMILMITYIHSSNSIPLTTYLIPHKHINKLDLIVYLWMSQCYLAHNHLANNEKQKTKSYPVYYIKMWIDSMRFLRREKGIWLQALSKIGLKWEGGKYLYYTRGHVWCQKNESLLLMEEAFSPRSRPCQILDVRHPVSRLW